MTPITVLLQQGQVGHLQPFVGDERIDMPAGSQGLFGTDSHPCQRCISASMHVTGQDDAVAVKENCARQGYQRSPGIGNCRTLFC